MATRWVFLIIDWAGGFSILQLLDVAKRWGAFVGIHAEDDPNSVQELDSLAAAYPSVPIILAHCLFTANTALVDGLLTKHPARFMVGTDAVNSWIDVKKAVRQMRAGLLPNLSPATFKLVAS